MGLEGAQQLRLGTTLAEDLSLITRTQVQQSNLPVTPIPRYLMSSSGL